VDCARDSWRRASSALSIARVMCVLIYFPNFDPIGSRSTKPANEALGLRHRHNNLDVTSLPKLYQWFRFYASRANLLSCSTCSRSEHPKHDVRHVRRTNIASNHARYARRTSKANNQYFLCI